MRAKKFSLVSAMALALTACGATDMSAQCPEPKNPHVLAVLAGISFGLSNDQIEDLQRDLREMSPGCKNYWTEKMKRK